jgi:hypothetical protein
MTITTTARYCQRYIVKHAVKTEREENRDANFYTENMKTLERTVYKCDHCGKNYFVRHAAERHEKYCMQNPANKHACFDCAFLTVDRQHVEEGFSEKTFHCDKLNLDLHSAHAERIGHSCLGYTERMPLQCADHKYAYDF